MQNAGSDISGSFFSGILVLHIMALLVLEEFLSSNSTEIPVRSRPLLSVWPLCSFFVLQMYQREKARERVMLTSKHFLFSAVLILQILVSLGAF